MAAGGLVPSGTKLKRRQPTARYGARASAIAAGGPHDVYRSNRSNGSPCRLHRGAQMLPSLGARVPESALSCSACRRRTPLRPASAAAVSMRPASLLERRGETHNASQLSAPDVPIPILIGGRPDTALVRAGQDGSRRGGQEPPSESTSWPVINARAHCTISRSCSSRCCSCVSACSGRTSFVACRWAGRSDMRGGPGRADCGEDGVDVQHPCVCPGRSSWRASADAGRADGARLERDARWSVARPRLPFRSPRRPPRSPRGRSIRVLLYTDEGHKRVARRPGLSRSDFRLSRHECGQCHASPSACSSCGRWRVMGPQVRRMSASAALAL